MARVQENEAEAVRTTIVGGRPPGSGRTNVPVPRGIEVLVKKAAVDAEFRKLLLAQRGKAAASIDLDLDPAESAMLSMIPREQLARIVDRTEVGTELRPAFMGRAAAVMLAALGASLVTDPSPASAQLGASPPAAPASQAQPAGTATSPPPPIYRAISGEIVGPDGVIPAAPPTNPPSVIQPQPPIIGGRSGGAGARVPPARVTPPPTVPEATNSSATNPPPAATNALNPSSTYSGRTVVVAGATVILDEPFTVPVPTNVAPPGAGTNQPATNAPPPASRVTPPFRPAMFAVMIQPPPPKPPTSNPPASTPPTNEP